MRTRTFYKSKVVIVVIVVIILVVLGNIYTSFNEHTYIATVTDKQRIDKNNDGNVDSYYLIFCKNEDVFIRGKFKSSTLYNQIEVGETYKFTVVGFRVGWLSWDKKIMRFEKVD